MNFETIKIETVHADWLTDKEVILDVLRLDKIHPVVSGNKWFKLKYYLQEAKALQKPTIATFGGAWSNHIIAAAYASRENGLTSIGIIRGEEPTVLSETLKKAIEYGMELRFVSRQHYQQKEMIIQEFSDHNWYWINEGGYGTLGVKGASEILGTFDISYYTHIVAAVGTGTMLAGLLSKATKQKVLGISVMKGNQSLEKEICNLLTDQKSHATFQIIHDYHFGGYGKHPPQLIEFINHVFVENKLPLDIVYTGKAFYAIKDLIKKNFFTVRSKVLMVHSGGLQGNGSLTEKVLVF